MNELTFKRASELLRYEPESGKLFWRIDVGRHGRIKAGTEAGCVHKYRRNTYRRIWIDGTKYRAHRIAYLLYYGKWPEGEIDHRNGDGLNNRPRNLLDVIRQENNRNKRKYSNNRSGFTGVAWDKRAGKWKVHIKIDGKQKHLGYFADCNEAAAAYRKAADEFGFRERHGA